MLNKVVLEFDRPFWEGTVDADFFGVVQPDPSNRGFLFMWWNFFRVIGKPILTALVAGPPAYRVEAQDPREVVREAVDTLQRVFGDSARDARLRSSYVTRWRAAEKFSRGSYSYIPPNADGTDYDAMAEPVADRLFFAGT